jgi:hypothetical protein
MLSLRIIIVAGLAGIAFWGLFQLLDNLKEPGLLRTGKAIVVKGCESVDDHEDARRLCPQLLCQKAVIDRKLVPRDAQFTMNAPESIAGQQFIGGAVNATGETFECIMSGLKVIDAGLIADSDAPAAPH